MVLVVIFAIILLGGCSYRSDLLADVVEVGIMHVEHETTQEENNETIIEAKREISVSKANLPVDNYFVYVDGKLSQVFHVYSEALDFASKTVGKNYIQDENKNILWDNYFRFKVAGVKGESGKYFDNLAAAIKYAKTSGVNEVVLKEETEKIVWSGMYKANHKIEGTPHIQQLPELARGCEVTSLSMLLNAVGVSADKMILAEQIKKDETPYKRSKGVIYYGNPNDGFVGDIYSFKKQGLGVYNGPIYDLAKKYTDRAVNLTGCELEDVLYFVSRDIPVWIITNSRYSHLPDNEFVKWVTPSGEINITYREHSVVIVGYDEQNIYFNDPLSSGGYSRVTRNSFRDAFNQMGNQAISCLTDDINVKDIKQTGDR